MAGGRVVHAAAAERPNHVWAYDFVAWKGYRMLNIVDEYTRERLAIKVARRLNSMDVLETLPDLFLLQGVPAHTRSDQGSEFIAEAVKNRRRRTAYIERGSPGERLCGELQRAAARRAAERRDLRYIESD